MDIMNSVKKCLFGGTLIGACLCSSATAGEITWNGGDAWTKVFRTGDSTFTSGSAWSTALDIANSGSASASGDSFGLSMAAWSQRHTHKAFSTLSAASFMVDQTTTYTFDWNIENTGSTFSLDIIGTGVINPDIEVNTGSGTFELTFLANEIYTMDVAMVAKLRRSLSFNMTENTVAVVPLPLAAFAGFGLLGCMAVKRRLRS